jgi:hypothetical protein
MAMPVEEFTLTDFLQHSGKVLPKVAEGEVLLHRRDGDDLVLMTSTQMEALQTTLRAFMSITDGGADRVATALPWFGFLEHSDQLECLRELRQGADATMLTGRLSELEEIIDEWRATGLAAWDEKRLRDRGEADNYNPSEPILLDRPR